ncbi:MAG: hypothetical protein HC882_01795, partial [Acidobacteria bacterium]|nr:hypothetical protein [Acidobacteriota bacterium]
MTTPGPTASVSYDGHDRVEETLACRQAVLFSAAQNPEHCAQESDPNRGASLIEVVTRDSEDRVTSKRVTGLTRNDASGAFALLSWQEYSYDQRGRLFESRTADSGDLPESGDCSLPGCRWLIGRTGYDARDMVVRTAVPSPVTPGTFTVSTVTRDGLGRVDVAADALGNETDIDRNLAGIATQRSIRESSGENPHSAGFGVRLAFDGLGRPISTMLASATIPGVFDREVARDADAQGRTISAWSPLGVRGSDSYRRNTEFDGLGRKVEERRRSGSAGEGALDGWIDVRYEYDLSGRSTAIVVEPEQAGGTDFVSEQRTEFAYDAQGRPLVRRLPDGREERTVYDSLGRAERTRYIGTADCDGDGTLSELALARTFDQQGRATLVTVDASLVDYGGTCGTHGYPGTTTQRFVYDGLGRVVETDDDGGPEPGTTIATVRAFDSL